MDQTLTGDRRRPEERTSDSRPGEPVARSRARDTLTWYGAAIGLVALTALLRWLTEPILGEQSRLLPFMLAVVVCTYGGGIGPGITTILLSTLAVALLLLDQPFAPTRADLVSILLFVGQACGVAFLTGALRRARDRARAMARQAEAAVWQKDQFVTRVSHEWRAPLNALAGWAAQLKQRPHDADFVTRAAANMMRAIETQSRLVEDLLDYSRGARGRLSIHPVRLLIATPIEASVEAVRQDAASRTIQLNVQLVDPGLRVWGDNQRLQQVFTNLLTNAVKFTPRGGAITVRARRMDDLVEVQVEDNGVGIDPKKLSSVFEPFAQGEPARDMALGGLGLGLSIAREIVLLHAGSIEATSAGAGRGSTFIVRLPVSAAVAVAGGEHASPAGKRP